MRARKVPWDVSPGIRRSAVLVAALVGFLGVGGPALSAVAPVVDYGFEDGATGTWTEGDGLTVTATRATASGGSVSLQVDGAVRYGQTVSMSVPASMLRSGTWYGVRIRARVAAGRPVTGMTFGVGAAAVTPTLVGNGGWTDVWGRFRQDSTTGTVALRLALVDPCPATGATPAGTYYVDDVLVTQAEAQGGVWPPAPETWTCVTSNPTTSQPYFVQDFEDGVTGAWLPFTSASQVRTGAAVFSSTLAHTGLRGMLVSGSNPTPGVSRRLAGMFSTSRPDEATVWVRLAPGQRPARVRMTFFDLSGLPVRSVDQGVVATADRWTQLVARFVAPTGGGGAWIALSVDRSCGGGQPVSFLVDDLALTRRTETALPTWTPPTLVC